MKNLTLRPLAAVAILATLGLSVPVMAVADTTTTTVAPTTTTVAPTTTTTVTGATTTTTVAKSCRVELLQWTRQYYRWHETRSDIYGRYAKATNRDLNLLTLALLRGNDTQAKAALTKYNQAVAKAKATRDAALTKLGAAPTQPTC